MGGWTLLSVGLWADIGETVWGCWPLAPQVESPVALEPEPRASVPENCQAAPEGIQKAQGRAEATRGGSMCPTSQRGGRTLPGLEERPGPDCGGFPHQRHVLGLPWVRPEEEGGARREAGQSGEPAGSPTRQKLSQGRAG